MKKVKEITWKKVEKILLEYEINDMAAEFFNHPTAIITN